MAWMLPTFKDIREPFPGYRGKFTGMLANVTYVAIVPGSVRPMP
jgi:hypothetical protein